MYKPQRGLEPFENVKYYNRNLIIFEYLWNRNRCYESTKGIFPCVDYGFDRCKIRYFYYLCFKSFLNYFETSRLNSIWTKTGILKYRAVTEADIFVLLRTKVIIKFQSLDAYMRGLQWASGRISFSTKTVCAAVHYSYSGRIGIYTAAAAQSIVSRIITK